MKRQHTFIKDLIALHKKGHILEREHQRILLEVFSSYRPETTQKLRYGNSSGFYETSVVVISQIIFDKRNTTVQQTAISLSRSTR